MHRVHDQPTPDSINALPYLVPENNEGESFYDHDIYSSMDHEESKSLKSNELTFKPYQTEITDRTAVAFVEVKVVSWRKRAEEFIDSNYTTIFMTIVTMFALFGDDVRMLAFTIYADTTFFALSTVALF
jgi:hypothetical protein